MTMNIKSILLIVVALVIAGVTALLARNLVSQPKATVVGEKVQKISQPKMQILVAATDMPVGHFVKAEDMKWQSWPDESVHERYIHKDSALKIDSFPGAVVNANITAGEPILNSRFIKPGERGFMAAVLPAGKRAISIRISATSGNAGFVFPGDRVDILLTHDVDIQSNNRDKAALSETVLKNVRVLAINQQADNPTHTPAIGKTATLEVTPKEAEKISLISKMGELTLVLRALSAEDDTPDSGPTITWDSEVSRQLSGGSSKEGNDQNFTVQVFRGSAGASEGFDFNQLFNQALEQNTAAALSSSIIKDTEE